MCLGLLALAGIAVLRASDSVDSVYFPKCLLHRLTGWYCTGCGATRAVHALVHGDLYRAWTSNQLLVVGMPVLASVWTWRRVQTALGRQPDILAPKWIWLIFIVIIAYGLLRNVPSDPFTLLAPH